MGAGYYIFFGFLVVVGLVGFFIKLDEISEKGKTNVLDEMYKNGDITETVYKKYKFKK